MSPTGRMRLLRRAADVRFRAMSQGPFLALLGPYIAERQACFRGRSKCQGRVESGRARIR